MKGYSPFQFKSKVKEVASKIQQAFIELGAIEKECDKDCTEENCECKLKQK